VVSVHPKQTWRGFGELMDAAHRSEIPFASPGIGTLMHLTGQLANAEYGTRCVHVPYKGSGPALQDAIGGQVPVIVDAARRAHGVRARLPEARGRGLRPYDPHGDRTLGAAGATPGHHCRLTGPADVPTRPPTRPRQDKSLAP
jgi:hypothetical protein